MTSSFAQGVFHHRPFLHNIAHTLTAAILALSVVSFSFIHVSCGAIGYYGPLVVVALILNAIAYFLGTVASFYTNERSKRFPAITAASLVLIFISFILQIATGAMDTETYNNFSSCATEGYYGGNRYFGAGYVCNWTAVGVELITFPFIFVLMFGGFKIAHGDEDIEAPSSPQHDCIAMDERPFSPEKTQ